MRNLLLAGIAAIALTNAASADQRFEARVVGHAMLPAATLIAPPADAPPGFANSGRFTGPGNSRVEALGSIPADTGAMHGNRRTGVGLPLQGQPVQGFSGIRPVGDGSYWVTTDNGFGTRRNSADALLMFHRIRPNFQTGATTSAGTVNVDFDYGYGG